MGNTTTPVQATAQSVLTFADLPALGAHLAGGTFAGLNTSPEGNHYALILLDDKPSTDEGRLAWRDAIDWAKKLDADLPSRTEGQLLFANVPLAMVQGWHWTNTQYSRINAWAQDFADGLQGSTNKERRVPGPRRPQIAGQFFGPLRGVAMHSNATQTPSRQHLIRASALRSVLRDRSAPSAGQPFCVALTAHVDTGACGQGWRQAWGYRKQMGMEPTHIRSGIRWLFPCDLTPVIEKVRLLGGPTEVKKTWGIGYKALLSDIQPRTGASHG